VLRSGAAQPPGLALDASAEEIAIFQQVFPFAENLMARCRANVILESLRKSRMRLLGAQTHRMRLFFLSLWWSEGAI
jgi:hypothetical protein